MNFSQSRSDMQERQKNVPPYVPYRTFQTFLEFLQSGIPDRIDRSIWGSRFSGSSGMQLMTALKSLQLVDGDGHPQPVLEELVFAEGERRRGLLRGLLQDYYRPVFQLDLSRATRNQFHEAFRSFGAREGVLAKCEAFFIRAARDAGVQLSQYITSGRHVGRRKAATPTRQRVTQQAAAEPAMAAQEPEAAPVAAAPAPPSPQAAAKLNVAEMILSKYPDFDPAWPAEVQAKWLEGMTKLYEGLAAASKPETGAATG
jgi:hypothetical protein